MKTRYDRYRLILTPMYRFDNEKVIEASSLSHLVDTVLFSGWPWGRVAGDTWEGSSESGGKIQEKLRNMSAWGFRSQETGAEPDGVRAVCQERNVCAMRKLPNPLHSYPLHILRQSMAGSPMSQFSTWYQINKQDSSDPVKCSKWWENSCQKAYDPSSFNFSFYKET